MKRYCPVCNLKLPNPLPPFCHQCGWDLENDITLMSSLHELPDHLCENYQKRVEIARKNLNERAEAFRKLKELEEEKTSYQTERTSLERKQERLELELKRVMAENKAAAKKYGQVNKAQKRKNTECGASANYVPQDGPRPVLEKGEFETTGEFDERINKSPPLEIGTVGFVSYNADTKMLKWQVKLNEIGELVKGRAESFNLKAEDFKIDRQDALVIKENGGTLYGKLRSKGGSISLDLRQSYFTCQDQKIFPFAELMRNSRKAMLMSVGKGLIFFSLPLAGGVIGFLIVGRFSEFLLSGNIFHLILLFNPFLHLVEREWANAHTVSFIIDTFFISGVYIALIVFILRGEESDKILVLLIATIAAIGLFFITGGLQMLVVLLFPNLGLNLFATVVFALIFYYLVFELY
ncbi:hypothetical protein [Dethiobacter alkaliphilus]|uniref:hypothetical protein n=1 Tax=Dethiobacter alkaliphilus TaxID=427926 RepID=UPI002226703E|nr:hypothetical protein [Dethiobacter alkaliphilus]MCW3488694.1 hypothetical protein [Dethiobacter alkaliphilus]